MSADKTGGPAFPCEVGPACDGYTLQTGNQQWMQPGMTLRDYFAAQTLADMRGAGAPEQVAKWAYEVADAMLAARSKT